MASTLAPPLPDREIATPKGGGNGRGFAPFGGGGGEPRGRPGRDDRRYYTGMMLGLGAVVMVFAAFTSAYVVRKGLSEDWLPTRIPPVLWINTVVLLASSVTLEKAKRALEDAGRFRRWWWLTTGLGVAFLAGQIVAWRQLAAAGVYVYSNPSSSFLYLLTGTHGVHLLGGVAALLYFALKSPSEPSGTHGKTPVGVTALYWHFMDGLWIYLFLLLLLWR